MTRKNDRIIVSNVKTRKKKNICTWYTNKFIGNVVVKSTINVNL